MPEDVNAYSVGSEEASKTVVRRVAAIKERTSFNSYEGK